MPCAIYQSLNSRDLKCSFFCCCLKEKVHADRPHFLLGDGKLGHGEFIELMKDRVKRGFRVSRLIYIYSLLFIPFTPDSAKSKIDKLEEIESNQHHSKVRLNSFPTKGHTVGFCPWNKKLENYVSPNVSLGESKD